MTLKRRLYVGGGAAPQFSHRVPNIAFGIRFSAVFSQRPLDGMLTESLGALEFTQAYTLSDQPLLLRAQRYGGAPHGLTLPPASQWSADHALVLIV